ncbi:MAG: hypothetical protein IJR59_00645 [Firmicutes bacterium]|nr:hypothetical protein [Bacillota bacterium]
MYVFSLEGEDIKKFMNCLLKEESFDIFRVHSCDIVTFCTFKIDGTPNKDYFEDGEVPDKKCPWSLIKPAVFSLIKGKRLPKLLKLVLAVPADKLPLLHDNLQEAFLNISYESGKINFTTGTLQKEFRLDKQHDAAFENYIKKLFKKLGLTATEQR